MASPAGSKGEQSRFGRRSLTSDEDGEPRVVTRRDVGEAVRRNAPWALRQDTYTTFVDGPWWRLIVLNVGLYVLINLIFAGLYLLDPDGVVGLEGGAFLDAFAFSVQTMTTIGYGAMSPTTPYTHMLVTVEAGIALIGVALLTGLAFAKMARPRSGVLFSNTLVVHPYEGRPSLLFRVGNARGNDVVEAAVSVALLRDEISAEGISMRRLYDLKLHRRRTPIFALTWTVFHVIDEDSPLFGVDPHNLDEQVASIVVSMTGFDATYAQTVHSRKIYYPEDFRFSERFVDVLSRLPDGRIVIDYQCFHDTEPLSSPEG